MSVHVYGLWYKTRGVPTSALETSASATRNRLTMDVERWEETASDRDRWRQEVDRGLHRAELKRRL